MESNFLKTRFAPSPTGLMHFGNLRTALFNYLYTKRHHGVFLLRVEDTDTVRSTREFQAAIERDLKWMGLNWDEGPFFQSDRQAIYNEYYHTLEKEGFLYPCFCTEAQLSLKRKIQMQAGKPPRYSGNCRNLSTAEVQQKKAAGIPYTLRFKIPQNELIEFEDVIKGPQCFESEHIGDFIVRRGDGSASFMFCNAIDDALMGVTHALRGDDHLTNTPRQILILKTLKLPVPYYGHFPIILGPDGKPLSKRNGSRSILELRNQGFMPLGIINYLSRLGHTDSEQTVQDLDGLSKRFDLSRISQSPARYDEQQLKFWQKEAFRNTSWQPCWHLIAESNPVTAKQVPEQKQAAFVEAVQANIMLPTEAESWITAFFAEVLPYDEEAKKVFQEVGKPFFEIAKELLSDQEVLQTFIKQLQEKSSLKGKAFFLPVRMALVGKKEGPELQKMLDLMGYEQVKARFLAALLVLE
jgi:glutamyl-tRNA synthetase